MSVVEAVVFLRCGAVVLVVVLCFFFFFSASVVSRVAFCVVCSLCNLIFLLNFLPVINIYFDLLWTHGYTYLFLCVAFVIHMYHESHDR